MPIKRPEILGFSFSQIQCEYLGLNNWRNIYQRALDLEPDIIRLAAYPNRPKEETHFLISEAGNRNIPVIFAAGGVKFFRWPEFFADAELDQYLKNHPQRILGNDPFVWKKVTEKLEENLDEFAPYENVKIIQVGNESLNIVSVAGGITESGDLLKRQVGLTRKRMKPDQRLLLTCSFPVKAPPFYQFLPTWMKPEEQVFRKSLELADVVGINDYTKTSKTNGYTEAEKEHYKRVKQFIGIVDEANGRDETEKELIGIEVQAEPWEEGNVVHIRKRQYPSYDPERMKNNVIRLLDAGIDTQVLWGVEHWIWHEEVNHNPEWIDAWRELKAA